MKTDYFFDLFMEVSTKSGLNVNKLFVEAGKILYKEYIINYKNKKQKPKYMKPDKLNKYLNI